MSIEIHVFVAGPLETNTYLLTSGTTAWVIDPAMGLDELIAVARQRGLDVRRVLLTHGHADHIAGIPQLRRAWPGLKVACPRADAAMLTDPRANLSADFGLGITVGEADELIDPGQVLRESDLELRVLDTAGHTAGGVSYYCPAAKVVFSGDSLLAGSIGRTDLPGGDYPRLIRDIRRNLLSLDDAVRVLPGHGPASTIARERRANPFLVGQAGGEG